MSPPAAKPRGFTWWWLCAPLSGLVAVGLVTADWYVASPPDALRNATFVGRNACIECHQQEYHDWEESHHDHAMELATEESVRADFDDAVFERLGVTTRFFRRGDEYWVNTEGPDGEYHDYQIKYTFGWEPLQQYMVEFPDGRVQVLRESWDTEREEWFFVPPPDAVDERLLPDDPTHWTGIAQNWNTTCAECHSTNLQKNYDLASDSYNTTWSEIDVSCEECHGPGSLHVELARSNSLFWDRRHGKGLVKLKSLDTKPQIETCAKCHSRRDMVHLPFRPGQPLCDQLRVSLLDEGLYYADGQILDEVYVYGSFVQSQMYHENVRCTDCHDPHSVKLKFEGNALCNQCHVPAKYDTPAHHFHKMDTPGASCVECHMPSTNYMVVDGRRDHSFRVPRPDLTVEVGTPNACNACHVKPAEDAKWAAEWVVKWYGDKRPDDPHWAPAIAGGRRGDPAAEELLRAAISRETTPDIVRATAIGLLGNYETPEAASTVVEATNHDSDVVRMAAIQSVPITSIKDFKQLIGKALEDDSRCVRLAAARRTADLLVQDPEFKWRLGTELLDAYAVAKEELRAELDYVQERAGAHVQLANLATGDGQPTRALDELRTAVRLEPYRSGLRSELAAMLQNVPGSEDEVNALRRKEIELLERDVAMFSDSAELRFQIGFLHYTLNEWQQAEESILKARELAPSNPRYVEGLASMYCEHYVSTGNDDALQKAVATLRQLEAIDPEHSALLEIGTRLMQARQSRGQ